MSAYLLNVPNKMPEVHSKIVIELQTEFFKRLKTHHIPPPLIVPSLLRRLLECDDEVVELSLGTIGHRLKNFAQELDFAHPELYSIFDGALGDDKEFSQECLELLSLAKFAKDQHLNRIIPVLGKIITKDSLSKDVFRTIDNSTSSRKHVRLLKDPDVRQEIRFTRKMVEIDLTSTYKKGEELWHAQPDNFKRFLRFETAYQEEIEKAERRASRYVDLGCSALAEEISKTVEIFKEHMNNSYYGFNRITMSNAAIILAKSLGYIYNLSSVDETLGKISVPREFFGNYNFDPDNEIGYCPIISGAAGKPIFPKRTLGPLLYEPRVYPLHQFWDLASESVAKTINTLEAFPDADGKPIFDHFAIIVPGVNFPRKNKIDSYSFLDENGLCQVFSKREEAVKELDLILVRNQHFHPIVIGDKDGRCYFICFFA